MAKNLTGFTSKAIHLGYDPRENNGALNPPVNFSSSFAFDTPEQGGARFAGEEEGYIYSRVGNPTCGVLEERIAALENGEAAIACSSGMGAITATLWSFLKAGDEIIADETIYGCTFSFLNEHLTKFGVKIHHCDFRDVKNIRRLINEKTRIIYGETIANPNNLLIDIAAIAQMLQKHVYASNIRFVIDNTYATPYICRPLDLGADIVVHSATKYLGGHGDLVSGLIIGRKQDCQQIREVGIKDMTGACMSPMDAFLIQRGLKTLAIRMERHSETAQYIAQKLEDHPAVSWVAYPGLKSFAQKKLADRLLLLPSGMIAFELKQGYEAGLALMKKLQMILCAVSLGDAHSLIQHPASMTHSTYTPEQLHAHGMSQGLVRLSVGLEDKEDIWADLEQALQDLPKTTSKRGYKATGIRGQSKKSFLSNLFSSSDAK